MKTSLFNDTNRNAATQVIMTFCLFSNRLSPSVTVWFWHIGYEISIWNFYL